MSKFLFGKSTDRDIALIHKTISDQQAYMKTTIEQVNVHTEILNHTIANLESLNNITENTIAAVKILKSTMVEQENTNDFLINTNVQQNIISEVELNLHNTRYDLITLVTGVDEMMTGYPSTNIIPDEVLSKLLIQASLVGDGLAFDNFHYPLANIYSKIHLYRKLSQIATLPLSNDTIMFYLSIPIAQLTTDFDLYKVQALPLPIINTTKFIQYEPESEFLAIAKDNKHYIPMKDLKNCLTYEETAICNPHEPILKPAANNCNYAIFAGYEQNTCKKTIITHFPPTLIRVREGYLYAMDKPTAVEVKCEHLHFTLTLNASGFLKASDDCTIEADTFIMLPHVNIMDHETTVHTSDRTFTYSLPQELKGPNINLTKLESMVLSKTADLPVELSAALTQLQFLNTTELLNATQQDLMELADWNAPRAYLTPSTSISYSMLILIAIMGIMAYYIYYKVFKSDDTWAIISEAATRLREP